MFPNSFILCGKELLILYLMSESDLAIHLASCEEMSIELSNPTELLYPKLYYWVTPFVLSQFHVQCCSDDIDMFFLIEASQQR